MATVANRIIEILPGGYIDKMLLFDDYLEDAGVQELQERYRR